MEKTSKVIAVTPNGTFESQYGADIGGGKKGFYAFEISFENGDTGQYSSKNKDQNKFVIGQESTYTYDGGKHPKVKPVTNTGFNKKFDPVFEKKKQIMIILQSSLKEANIFHQINGYDNDSELTPLDQTLETMEHFAERIMKNKYLQ